MNNDLFGAEISEPRKNDRPKAAALVEVLKTLRGHRFLGLRV